MHQRLVTRITLGAAAALFTVGWIAALPAAPQAGLQKIAINYPTRSGASWPMFIAKEGGYYQKYGLDVTLTFGVHPTAIAALVNGQVQMTNYSLEQAMQASARDASMVIVGSSLNRGLFSLIARKDIASIRELKGKRVAVAQVGDAPYNYTVALLSKSGIGPREVQWVPVGTDVSGRVAALQSGRADATILTAPAFFRLEEAGYKNLANLAEHEDIFASTSYLLQKATVQANPRLPELLIRAHAEAIKRFYDDKPFAVKAYMVYDKQAAAADVERIHDRYASTNAFERVPYVLAGAIKAVVDQQSDPQMAALLKGFDFRKVVDNSYVERLVKEGFFEKLYGPSIKAEQDRKAKLAFR